MMNVEFGRHLRAWRRVKDKSLEDVAAELGIERLDLIKIEMGLVQWAIDNPDKMINVLEVDRELFNETWNGCKNVG